MERIFIRDYRIGGCFGCEACRRNAGVCVQKDDMEKLYHAMNEADVIVFSSPVCFYSWTSQMKAVIDRIFAVEKVLSNKTFYLITAGAAPDVSYMENMVSSYRLLIRCFRNEGNQNGGEIIGIGANAAGDIWDTKAVEEAYRMGRLI